MESFSTITNDTTKFNDGSEFTISAVCDDVSEYEFEIIITGTGGKTSAESSLKRTMELISGENNLNIQVFLEKLKTLLRTEVEAFRELCGEDDEVCTIPAKEALDSLEKVISYLVLNQDHILYEADV